MEGKKKGGRPPLSESISFKVVRKKTPECGLDIAYIPVIKKKKKLMGHFLFLTEKKEGDMDDRLALRQCASIARKEKKEKKKQKNGANHTLRISRGKEPEVESKHRPHLSSHYERGGEKKEASLSTGS